MFGGGRGRGRERGPSRGGCNTQRVPPLVGIASTGTKTRPRREGKKKKNVPQTTLAVSDPLLLVRKLGGPSLADPPRTWHAIVRCQVWISYRFSTSVAILLPPSPFPPSRLLTISAFRCFPFPKRSLALSAARHQVFIKELIQGSPLGNQKEFVGRSQAKHFLYQIVANKINGTPKITTTNQQPPRQTPPLPSSPRCPRTQAHR